MCARGRTSVFCGFDGCNLQGDNAWSAISKAPSRANFIN